MKNLLNEEWYQWVTQYQKTTNNPLLHKICNHLLLAIPNALTIALLLDVIKKYLTPDYAAYLPVNFQSQLSRWHHCLEKTQNDCATAQSAIRQIDKTLQTHSLGIVIGTLFDDPGMQLHCSMPSLLKALKTDALSQLLRYLIELDNAPYPTAPPKGSFAAMIPTNHYHQACIGLLVNLTAANQTHPWWETANTLLQTAIIIYRDLHLVEVGLLPYGEKKEAELVACSLPATAEDSTHDNRSGCIIF